MKLSTNRTLADITGTVNRKIHQPTTKKGSHMATDINSEAFDTWVTDSIEQELYGATYND